MTQPASPPRGAPGHPPAGPRRPPPDDDEVDDGPVRAIIVVILAVVIGGAFLFVGFDDEGTNQGGIDLGALSDDDSTTTTVADGAAASGRPAAEVPVYAAGADGAAAGVTEQLRSLGYTAALDPGDAPASSSTLVYFLPDWEAEAVGVANTLGLGPDVVLAWPDPPPFPPPFGGTVIVQVGSDLSG